MNPAFNYSKSLLSFSVDKVTTGTYNLQSVTLKVAPLENDHELLDAAVTNLFSKLVITQVADQFKDKDTSQLINGISSVLQKLLKYFNGTEISTSFVPSLFAS